MLKNYSDYIALNALEQVILEDVKCYGNSSGWDGDYETFQNLKNKLQKHQIMYKYLGRWELVD